MKILCLLLFSITFSFLSAQTTSNTVIAAGGNNSGNVSFTIGEPVINTSSTSNNIITQGFHQTMFIISAIKDELDANMPSFSIYPNPASTYFFLEVESEPKLIFDYRMTNLVGALIETGTFNSSKKQFDLSQLSNTGYILLVFNEQRGYKKTFKIQKAQ